MNMNEVIPGIGYSLWAIGIVALLLALAIGVGLRFYRRRRTLKDDKADS